MICIRWIKKVLFINRLTNFYEGTYNKIQMINKCSYKQQFNLYLISKLLIIVVSFNVFVCVKQLNKSVSLYLTTIFLYFNKLNLLPF